MLSSTPRRFLTRCDLLRPEFWLDWSGDTLLRADLSEVSDELAEVAGTPGAPSGPAGALLRDRKVAILPDEMLQAFKSNA